MQTTISFHSFDRRIDIPSAYWISDAILTVPLSHSPQTEGISSDHYRHNKFCGSFCVNTRVLSLPLQAYRRVPCDESCFRILGTTLEEDRGANALVLWTIDQYADVIIPNINIWHTSSHLWSSKI